MKDRSGTTLVELMAAMGLMTLVMTMAAGCMLSGAAVMHRLEARSAANILLDAALEQLRGEVENACGYIAFSGDGLAVEYLDAAGTPTRLSAEGCSALEAGRLARHTCEPLAESGRAWYPVGEETSCAELLHQALYQGLSLKIEFSAQEENTVLIAAEAYRHQTKLVARQSVAAELRHAPQWLTGLTE